MKTLLSPLRLLAACCALLASVAAVAQSPSGLVISQVYGASATTGSTYNADFVEIYNPTTAAISTSGLSIQYASATGNFTQSLALSSATIQPGHYFLIQTTTAGTVGANLPTPDTIGSSPNLSGSNGKVALVNGTTALSGDTTCAAVLADTAIIDLLGYGTTANCFLGSSYAPTPSATSSDNRATPSMNARNNSTDFSLLSPPNPHNSSYVASGVAASSLAGSASPNPVNSGSMVTLTVTVTPPTGGTTTGTTVTGDLSTIGGSSTTAFTAGANNTYTTTATVTYNGSGTVTIPVSATDAQGNQTAGSIGFTVNQGVQTIAIDVIQGPKSTTAMAVSPYAGKQVTTTGVVTTVLSNAFFIQTPDAQADTNPLTPEGIEIFTSSKPTVSIGNLVQVTGTVQTYPAVTASHTPATELTSPTVTVQQASVALPAAITLTPSMLTPGGGLYQLTPYEGMRVAIPSFTTSSGTGGTLTESTETVVSTGQFYGIITGTYGNTGQVRPFREPGIDIRDSFTPQPSNVAHFDDNPERILIDSKLSGGTAIDLSTGAVMANVTGVLDFTYSSDTYYDPSRLILDATYSASNITPGYTVTTFPVPAKKSNEFTVASYNIERFYNTQAADDIYAVPQGVSCFSGDASKGTNLCTSEATDVTAAAYTRRLQKLSLAIRTVLNSPDVLTLEEIENQSVANDIAAQLNSDIQTATGTAGQYVGLSTDNSTYYTQDGTGISVGILYNAATVDNLGFTQYGQGESFTPSTNNLTTLNDRPWVILSAGLKRANAKDYPVTVIANHMKSLINQNSQTSNSTRLKKELQAEDIAKYIQKLQAAGAHVISGGDFNAFEFADGYNDTLGTYTNTNVLPANQVVQPGVAGLVTPPLSNLALTLPANQRWSYQEDGSAQILDHMVVTPELVTNGAHFAYGHNNADFALINQNSATTAARTSDHDPAIGYFVLPAPVLSATLTPSASTDFGTVAQGSSSNGMAFTLTNTGEAAITITSITASGDFAATTACGTSLNYTSPNTCAINVVFTPKAAGQRTGTLTVVTSAGTYTTALTGTGMAPVYPTLNPTSLVFASTVVNTPSGAKTVTLTSTSTVAIPVASITVSGDFAQTNNCGTSLAANSSCTINVTFTPTVASVSGTARTGTLSVTTTGPSATMLTASLSGTGVTPDFTVADSTGSASTALTVVAGSAGSVALQFTSLNSFTGPVSITCTSANPPTGVTCTPPANFTLTTAGSVQTVNFMTTARTYTAGLVLGAHSGPVMTAVGLSLFGLLMMLVSRAGLTGRRLQLGGLMAMVFAACIGMTGCGSSGPTTKVNPLGTPAGTYTYIVTATSGTSSHSETITLTVQ